MTTCTAERRRYPRMPVAYPAVLVGSRGQILARGRAANASERGIFMIVSANDSFSQGKRFILHLTVPYMSGHCQSTRKVVYRCLIARRQELGNLVGLGLEFGEKLA